MFTETEDDETNVCFVDWQTARYGSPGEFERITLKCFISLKLFFQVMDIMFCIFTCTTRALRGHYYNKYLRTYHESLSNLLIA